MTDQEIIKTIAELEGWWFDNCGYAYAPGCKKKPEGGVDGYWCAIDMLPPYLTSRDAIIPVIEKCCEPWDMDVFIQVLTRIILDRDWKLQGKKTEEFTQFGWMYSCVISTPSQLCEALLRATGKWTE